MSRYVEGVVNDSVDLSESFCRLAPHVDCLRNKYSRATLFDVLPGTAAYEAGLGPNMTIVAVDGHDFSPDILNESIAHSGWEDLSRRSQLRYDTDLRDPLCGGHTLSAP